MQRPSRHRDHAWRGWAIYVERMTIRSGFGFLDHLTSIWVAAPASPKRGHAGSRFSRSGCWAPWELA